MASIVIGVVPARLGSTRFPGKMLQEIGGRPLVVRAFERLSAASRVGEAFIATDSDEIEAAARAHGAPVLRVNESCHTGSDRVARAVDGLTFDIVVNLQGDQPAIEPHDIDRVVDALEEDTSVDMATLAFEDGDPEAFESRDVVKVVTSGSGRALYFSRAPIPSAKREEQGNPLFLHHVGIYCFRQVSLARFAELPRGRLEERESLEQLRALEAGMSIAVLVSEHSMPDVDRPSDLGRVDKLFGG